jgi:glycosyltransferase involved in cell wall biosynthesis
MRTIGIAGPLDLHLLQDYIDSFTGTLPTGLGGTVLPPLIIEFLKQSRKVVVFTLDKNITEPISFNGKLLKICVSPSRQNHRARDFFALERQFLVRSIQREKINLIHAHWTYEFALAAIDSGVPALITTHDAPLRVLKYHRTLYQFMRTLMAFATIKKTEHMTAVSPYIASHLKNTFHYDRNLIVIPNGLSQDVFSLYRGKEHTAKQKFIFAAVLNGWGRLKNTSTLLRAFSVVRQILKSTELWLFGIEHGPNEQAEQWARKNKVTDDVRFIGYTQYQAMLRLLKSDVDIIVHPSLEESFSYTIVEALALGIPVIGGCKSGAVPSTLGNGEAGILADVDSYTKLAEAMISLANNVFHRERLSEAGRAYALRNYQIEQVALQYEHQYHKAI